ncbi:M35 family metallo-endopeptidase [Dyella sp.]|uniref:M35 family metallo-endopeptidase n=1 Tax=Dyella sp. TaxID=1869338 RepID=UPI002ED52C59
MKKMTFSLCAAMLPMSVAYAGNIDIQLLADTSTQSQATVTVTATNHGDTEERISRWDLPFEFDGSLAAPLLEVTHDGKPVNYIGKLIKRAPIDEGDTIALAPGQMIAMKIHVARAYDLTAGGRFEVRYKTDMNGSGRKLRADNTITIDVVPSTPKLAAFNRVAAGDTQFRGCSASQGQAIRGARQAATQMINGASWAMSGSVAGNRYTYWFGNHDDQRHATVKSNINEIKAAVDNAGITVDCSCTESGVFAYVYPNQPYDVYVCPAFWSANNTGTDSRGGTLIHELSHFTAVAGTDDHAYGQWAARQLAQQNPAFAIANADNYEYFSENSPDRD